MQYCQQVRTSQLSDNFSIAQQTFELVRKTMTQRTKNIHKIITMSSMDRSKWPTKYDLKEIDGKAVLPRDFFPTCCPSQLDDAWAARTVHFRPYFEGAALKSGIVDRDHHCGKNTRENVVDWKNKAKRVILGKKYRDRMKSGWNKAMEELTRSNGSDAMGGDGTVGPNFSFRGKKPISQEDVGTILFGPEVSNLVKSGSLEQLMALLFSFREDSFNYVAYLWHPCVSIKIAIKLGEFWY